MTRYHLVLLSRNVHTYHLCLSNLLIYICPCDFSSTSRQFFVLFGSYSLDVVAVIFGAHSGLKRVSSFKIMVV